MNRELAVRNCQRACKLDARLLRRVVRRLLEQEFRLSDYVLGIQFVSERCMAKVNWQFLQHEGPTDVITFDYREPEARSPKRGDSSPSGHSAGPGAGIPGLHGELFICPAVAKAQAKQYCSTMAQELVRYLVHGILHLRGFDDQTAAARKRMKREEARLLRRLSWHFKLSRLRNAPG